MLIYVACTCDLAWFYGPLLVFCEHFRDDQPEELKKRLRELGVSEVQLVFTKKNIDIDLRARAIGLGFPVGNGISAESMVKRDLCIIVLFGEGGDARLVTVIKYHEVTLAKLNDDRRPASPPMLCGAEDFGDVIAEQRAEDKSIPHDDTTPENDALGG